MSSADIQDEFIGESYVIPDTPVVATGMNLTAFANTPFDINIARGESTGYTDPDLDEATQIIVTGITNGEILPTPGYADDPSTSNIDESRVFHCVEGGCNATFQPAKDFFTDTDLVETDREYAYISYKVVAGNSTSEIAMMKIKVKPKPRALGFEILAQQDEFRDIQISDTNDGLIGKDQVIFSGYTYPLDSTPSKIYIRNPLDESARKGKVYLPLTVICRPR